MNCLHGGVGYIPPLRHKPLILQLKPNIHDADASFDECMQLIYEDRRGVS